MPSEVSTGGTEDNRELTVDELKRELREAREQQAATAEILGVISSAPTELQRVFAEIAASAARLCDAYDAGIFQVEGDSLRTVAHHGPISMPDTLPLTREVTPGRAVLERRTIHIADLQAEADEFPDGSVRARHLGFRTILNVPLIRAGDATGVISIRRTEVRPFTDRQTDLLKTFANQAVIAIENTRLFEAEQARTREVTERTRELTEALEQQTATAEILKVIASSPDDVQPVFQAIAERSNLLLKALSTTVFSLVDGKMHLEAFTPVDPEADATLQATFPAPLAAFSWGEAIRKGEIHRIVDSECEPEGLRDLARHRGWRSCLCVPLLHDGKSIGMIGPTRAEPGPFNDHHVQLLQTFADQAVIAIENTRLFEAEQASKRELQESLEYQTATSEILGVISRSPTDLKPVLDAILATAARLCSAEKATIRRREGNVYAMVAEFGFTAEQQAYMRANPVAAGSGTVVGRAAETRRPVYIPDVETADGFTQHDLARGAGFRAGLAVPLLREGDVIGVLMLLHSRPDPFTADHIERAQTFADQSVIAIENTRLFDEVRARNRDLTALGEVGRAVSSTLDLKVVLKTVVERAVNLSGTDAGSIFYYRVETRRFELGETTGLDEAIIARLRKLDIAARDSGLGEAIAHRKPLLIPDLTKRESNPLRAAAIEAGFRAALIVPLLSSDGPLGTLVLQRRNPGEFPEAIVSLMQSFADQSAIALENARLFEEIAQKSRELEIASQHKSQFVANMSHELRTPLAAILGYAELMQEGFYEPLGQKSLDALTRIRSNGKHLLGLINTVLDIAKIESGQFTLNMAEYDIESVVETVRSATESLAQSKRLELKTEVAKSLPTGLGDEQRLTQVLLNLVGNAIKFTDTGEVRIAANAVNGRFNVTVTDTGPGIPAEHQARIFEQFHQVDSSNTKAKGGTGLGLAIAKQIVEMHGGRIWVESTVGKGSTFQMELPTRAEFRKMAP
jgi:signal transduction histidine kinase/putative methionine-R-sulfoxide reductase with GAF domain